MPCTVPQAGAELPLECIGIQILMLRQQRSCRRGRFLGLPAAKQAPERGAGGFLPKALQHSRATEGPSLCSLKEEMAEPTKSCRNWSSAGGAGGVLLDIQGLTGQS